MMKLIAIILAVYYEIGGCYGYKNTKLANTFKSCLNDCIYKKDGYNYCQPTVQDDKSKGRCCDSKTDFTKYCDIEGYQCTPKEDAKHIKASYCPDISEKLELDSTAETKQES